MEQEEGERKRGLLAHGSADGPTAFVLLGMEIEELQYGFIPLLMILVLTAPVDLDEHSRLMSGHDQHLN